MNGWPNSSRRRGVLPYWYLVLRLLAHFAGSGLIFVGLIGVEWLCSFAYDWLDAIHKFPVEMADLIPGLRVGWVYLDILLSAAVLLGGLNQFVRDIFFEDK